MKSKTTCYWEPKNNQSITILPTFKIAHTCIYVQLVLYTSDITRSVFNRNQARRKIPRYTICITDVYYDYILDKIICRYQIDFEIHIDIDDEYE